jgi:hypothetical protein
MSVKALLLLTWMPAAINAEAAFGDQGRRWWIAHGLFMVLAFALLFPYGALIAICRRRIGERGRFFRGSVSFYPLHRNFQVFGLLVMFLGLILGAIGSRRVYGTGNPFAAVLWDYTNSSIKWNRHVKIGVSVLLMASIQSILGYWSHLLKSNHDIAVANGDVATWKRPYVPSWLHVVMGAVTVVLAYIAMFQGLQIFNFIFHGSSVGGGIVVGYIFVTLSATVFVVAYMFEKYSVCKNT